MNKPDLEPLTEEIRARLGPFSAALDDCEAAMARAVKQARDAGVMRGLPPEAAAMLADEAPIDPARKRLWDAQRARSEEVRRFAREIMGEDEAARRIHAEARRAVGIRQGIDPEILSIILDWDYPHRPDPTQPEPACAAGEGGAHLPPPVPASAAPAVPSGRRGIAPARADRSLRSTFFDSMKVVVILMVARAVLRASAGRRGAGGRG